MEYIIRDAARRGDHEYLQWVWNASNCRPLEFWQTIFEEAVLHARHPVVSMMLKKFPQLNKQKAVDRIARDGIRTDSMDDLHGLYLELMVRNHATLTCDVLNYFLRHPEVSDSFLAKLDTIGKDETLLATLYEAVLQNDLFMIRRVIKLLGLNYVFLWGNSLLQYGFAKGILTGDSRISIEALHEISEWCTRWRPPPSLNLKPDEYGVILRLVKTSLDANPIALDHVLWSTLRKLGVALEGCPGILTTVAESGNTDAMMCVLHDERARRTVVHERFTEWFSAVETTVKKGDANTLRVLLSCADEEPDRAIVNLIVQSDNQGLIQVLLTRPKVVITTDMIRQAIARGQVATAVALMPSLSERWRLDDVLEAIVKAKSITDWEREFATQCAVMHGIPNYTRTGVMMQSIMNDAIRRRQFAVVRILHESARVPLPEEMPLLWHARARVLDMTSAEWAVGATTAVGMSVMALLAMRRARRVSRR